MLRIIQLHQRGVSPPKVVTRITGIWVIGYSSMYFSGSFIAGALTDYLPYSGMLTLQSQNYCYLIFSNSSKADEWSHLFHDTFSKIWEEFLYMFLVYYYIFKYFLISVTAEILAGVCVLAIILCVLMRLYIKKSPTSDIATFLDSAQLLPN